MFWEIPTTNREMNWMPTLCRREVTGNVRCILTTLIWIRPMPFHRKVESASTETLPAVIPEKVSACMPEKNMTETACSPTRSSAITSIPTLLSCAEERLLISFFLRSSPTVIWEPRIMFHVLYLLMGNIGEFII